MPSIHFFVEGRPKAQPRPRAAHYKGHARVYDPGTAEGWKGRIALKAVSHRQIDAPHLGAVSVTLYFAMPRPKGHFGTGENKGKIKDSATKEHTSKPDIDNLAKAVLDELTLLEFWKDDAQIVTLTVYKVYTYDKSGVHITIHLLDSGDG